MIYFFVEAYKTMIFSRNKQASTLMRVDLIVQLNGQMVNWLNG